MGDWWPSRTDELVPERGTSLCVSVEGLLSPRFSLIFFFYPLQPAAHSFPLRLAFIVLCPEQASAFHTSVERIRVSLAAALSVP